MPTARCCVCDAPAVVPVRPTAAAAAVAPLCGSLICRWKYDAVPARRRCAACARPLGPDNVDGVCATRECRLRHAPTVRAEHERRVVAGGVERRDEAAAQAAVAGADAGDLPVVLLDYVTPPSRRLSDRRRQAARAQLAETVHAAFVHRAAGNPPRADFAVLLTPDDALGDVLGRACAHCRGGCCATGGEHAYISTTTVRRYLDAHPDATEASIVDDYIDRVPARTMRDGCVFQAPRGCALPREMRSDTCNNFFCAPLLAVASRAADRPPRAFVARRGDGRTIGAFIEPGATRVVRRRPLPLAPVEATRRPAT